MDTQLISSKLTPGNLLDLPEEILVKVFSFLPPASLTTAAAVCNAFNRISSGDEVWRPLCQQNNLQGMEGKPYKEIYKESVDLLFTGVITKPSDLDKIVHCVCRFLNRNTETFYVKKEGKIIHLKGIISRIIGSKVTTIILLPLPNEAEQVLQDTALISDVPKKTRNIHVYKHNLRNHLIGGKVQELSITAL